MLLTFSDLMSGPLFQVVRDDRLRPQNLWVVRLLHVGAVRCVLHEHNDSTWVSRQVRTVEARSVPGVEGAVRDDNVRPLKFRPGY